MIRLAVTNLFTIKTAPVYNKMETLYTFKMERILPPGNIVSETWWVVRTRQNNIE